MTREEKILLAIEKGITCDPITGKVYGVKGKEVIKKNLGYIDICFRKDRKLYYIRAHQFIYYWVHKKIAEQIDHINRVRDDNRIENLRSVTNQQNQFNRSGIKGCCYDKQMKKWRTTISINGKYTYIGLFNTEQEARQAYLDAKKIHHII